jgi:hypothetical protein
MWKGEITVSRERAGCCRVGRLCRERKGSAGPGNVVPLGTPGRELMDGSQRPRPRARLKTRRESDTLRPLCSATTVHTVPGWAGLGCAEQTGHVRALLLPPGRTRLPGPAQLFAAINASRSKRTASATQCTHHVAFCTSPPSGFFRFCRCCQLKEQLLRPKYPLL